LQTYGRGIRATALAVYDRPQDRKTLEADARWLIQTTDGMHDLSRLRLRPYTIDTLGTHAGYLTGLKYGRGHVLLSALDITCGLLGTQTWAILGFDAAYAQSLLQNIILWTLDGQADESFEVTRAPRPWRHEASSDTGGAPVPHSSQSAPLAPTIPIPGICCT